MSASRAVASLRVAHRESSAQQQAFGLHERAQRTSSGATPLPDNVASTHAQTSAQRFIARAQTPRTITEPSASVTRSADQMLLRELTLFVRDDVRCVMFWLRQSLKSTCRELRSAAGLAKQRLCWTD